ncbi:YrzA family protein [Paenibacillus sp. IB182496]|uniref:YrzA family protein n=1 Tax=Paenibacillus sabuli TaxID=2772509 RepID=A0A927BSV4_9BACL|nr:YrzA family protein [Paenibacillus sabuli]MBD2845065.1 YrzA family protein [Paenibacillus sabuli]
MELSLSRIHDKIELFEAYDMKTLERQIDAQIENNQALMLRVASVSHQVTPVADSGRMLYSAVVHFKAQA